MNIRHVILLAAELLLGGCALLTPDAAVDVVIPAPPGHWLHAFPDMRFLLEYRDAEGGKQSLEVAEWWRPVAISYAKQANSPILAYPLTSRGTEAPGSLRPAGGLYPGSLSGSADGEVLQLTWEDGALAALLSHLQEAELDVSLLNAARLGGLMSREGDPWSLDLDGMAEELAAGEFTAYDADPLPCRDAVIVTGEGTWFLESPFQDWRTAEEGVVTLADVSLGAHGLYSAEGRFILMQVGEEGVVAVPQCP